MLIYLIYANFASNHFDMFRIISYVLFGLFLCLMVACESQSLNSSASNGSSKSIPHQNTIVYLFFEMEATSAGGEKVTHTDTKIAEGTLKSSSVENKENIPGNLLITMLGKDGGIIEERIIEDPLNPVLEVYAEEGLNKAKVKLKKADFSVRFNQKGTITSVKVEKLTINSKNNLLTIKL